MHVVWGCYHVFTMETAIEQKACRNSSRQAFPLYAISTVDTSPLFVYKRPSSRRVASKCPDLPATKCPTVKGSLTDRNRTSGVDPSTFSGFISKQKVPFAAPFTRSPREYRFSRVHMPGQTADFNKSPHHGSCPSVAAFSAVHIVGRGLYFEREKSPPSALPQGSSCVSSSELSPGRSASSGLLTCRSRKRHSARKLTVHMTSDVPHFGAFRYSPIPAHPEEFVNSSWCMRLQTQIARRPSTYSDGTIPLPSSVSGEAPPNISGKDAEKQQHFIDATAREDAAFNQAQQVDRISRSHECLGINAPAPLATVSGCSRYKNDTPVSSPRNVPSTNKAVPDSATECSTHFLSGSAPASNHSSGSNGVTSVDTVCNSIYRQCDFTGACCGNTNADSGSRCSTTCCPNRTICITGHSQIRTESSIPVSAVPLGLKPVKLISRSRPTSVTGSARASSPSALRTASNLNSNEAAPEGSWPPTGSCRSAQIESYPTSDRAILTQGKKCEKSCCTGDPLRRHASDLSTSLANTKEGHSDEVEKSSAVLQDEPQRARHANQHIVRQAEDTMLGFDTPASHSSSPAFASTMTGKDEHNKSVGPLRTDRCIMTELQSERVGSRDLAKACNAGDVALLPKKRAAQKSASLVQQANFVQRLLNPPPSPLHFFFPLHYRLPPQPLQSSLPDENSLSLDDEELEARPAKEFATMEFFLEDTPSSITHDKFSPTRTKSAVADPDAPLTGEGKQASADVGAPVAETSSGNSVTTTSEAAASAATDRSFLFGGDVSASPLEQSKTLSETSAFQASAFDAKTPACLSFHRSPSEEDCISFSRVPGLEQPPPSHQLRLASGQTNGRSAGGGGPYPASAPEKVIGDANNLCNDTDAGSADYSAPRQPLTDIARRPHSGGVVTDRTLEAIPNTVESETISKQQTTTPPASMEADPGQSCEESLRASTEFSRLTLTPRTRQAAAGVRGASKEGDQSFSVVGSRKASLATGLSVSSMSYLGEECPRCSNELHSSLCLFSQPGLQTHRPLQKIHCVKALSLPASSVSPYSSKHQQQQRLPGHGAVIGATVALTDPQLKCVARKAESSGFHGRKTTLKAPAGQTNSPKNKQCGATATTRKLLGEQDRERPFRRPHSAAGRCDLCRDEKIVCFGVGSPTALPPRTPLSARRTNPQATGENNIPVICRAERCGCCACFRGSARTYLNASPIHESPASDLAPPSSVAGCTICPEARSVSVRARCHPEGAQEQRPHTSGIQSLTECCEKRSLRQPHCTRRIVQTSGHEGTCNWSVTTRRFEPSVNEGAANKSDTIVSGAERRRAVFSTFSREGIAPHASATAFLTCASPIFVASPSCTARRSTTTLDHVSQLHVARTRMQSFTQDQDNQLPTIYISGSRKKCSTLPSSSRNTVRHKVFKRQLKRRKLLSGNCAVRIRHSLWQALQENIVALAQSAFSRSSAGRTQGLPNFPLRPGDIGSSLSLKRGRPRSEQPAFGPQADVVVFREKPALNTTSLRTATSTSRDYFGDGHQKPTEEFVDISTLSVSSSPAGSDLRGSEVEVEIKSREGRKEQGSLRGRPACNVLRSAENLLSIGKTHLCATDTKWGSSLDSVSKMKFEEAARGITHNSKEGSMIKTTHSLPVSLSAVAPDFLAASAGAGRKSRKTRAPARDNSHRGGTRPSSSKPQSSCDAVSIDEAPRKRLQQRNDTHEEHCNISCCASNRKRSSYRKHTSKHTDQSSKNASSRFSRSPPAPVDEVGALLSPSISSSGYQMPGSEPGLHTAERLHYSACGDTEGRGQGGSSAEPGNEYKAVRMQNPYIVSKDRSQEEGSQRIESSAAVSKSRMMSAWSRAKSDALTNRSLNSENGAHLSESQKKEHVCQQVLNRAIFRGEAVLESERDLWTQPSCGMVAAVTVVSGLEGGYMSDENIVEGQEKRSHSSKSPSYGKSLGATRGIKEIVQYSTTADGRCSVNTLRMATEEHDCSSPSGHTSAHQAKYNTDDDHSTPNVQLQRDSQSQVSRGRSRRPTSARRKHSKGGSRLYRRRATSRVSGGQQSECRKLNRRRHFSRVYRDDANARGNEGPSQACLQRAADCNELSSRERENNTCDTRYQKESGPHSSGCCSAEREDQCAVVAHATGNHSGWHVGSPLTQVMHQMLPSEDADNQNEEQQCATKHGEKQMAEQDTPMDCQEKHDSCPPELTGSLNEAQGVSRPTTVLHTNVDLHPLSHLCHTDTPLDGRGEQETRQPPSPPPPLIRRVEGGGQCDSCAGAASKDFIGEITFAPRKKAQTKSPGPSVFSVADEAPRTLRKEGLFDLHHECRNGLKPRLVVELNARAKSFTVSRVRNEPLLCAYPRKYCKSCVGADQALPLKSQRSKLDYCPPGRRDGPLVHATGSGRCFTERMYLAVSHHDSLLGACTEPSNSSHPDSDHTDCGQMSDQPFPPSEAESNKVVPQKHTPCDIPPSGKPRGPLHTEGDQRKICYNVRTTSFPHCNHGIVGDSQISEDSAGLSQFKRPSLSKMDLLIEKIVSLRQTVTQKEDIFLLDAPAPRSSPAECGNRASPVPSSKKVESSGLPSYTTGKCLTFQGTKAEKSSKRPAENDKKIRQRQRR